MSTLKMKLERKKRGLTQTELAEMLNTTKQSISNWEHGICVPSYGKLKELEKVLDKSIDELLKPVDEEIECRDTANISNTQSA